MNNIKPFYRIQYQNGTRHIALYGAVQASLFATINELSVAGISAFVVNLLSAEEFNSDESAPYTLPIYEPQE